MNFPKQLFRFRPWSVLKRDREGNVVERKCLSDLQDGVFYCSSPREFDDPQDNQLGGHMTGSLLDMGRLISHDFAGASELLRKHKHGSFVQLPDEGTADSEDREIVASAAGRQHRRNSRVLCFSSDCMNELMWAFYADNHRGVCLCFDTDHEFFHNAESVIYDHSPKDDLAACKSLAWRFQNEWRIILSGNEPRKVLFPKEKLVAIILGYRFSAPQLGDLETVLIRGGYSVEILRVDRAPNSYEYFLSKVGSVPKPVSS